MTKKPIKSPAVQLIDHVWANANHAGSPSWDRLNRALHRSLKLAIVGGFEFGLDDIEHVVKCYNSSHWIGADIEWIYTHAVEAGNPSAWLSFEAYRKRQPLIADNVTIFDGHSRSSTRQRERLCVGAQFPYRGLALRVNSFGVTKDGIDYVNCASYKSERDKLGYDREAIDQRFKITAADIKAERKLVKDRDELIERLTNAVTVHAKIFRALKLSKKTRLEDVPLERLREVADKFAPRVKA